MRSKDKTLLAEIERFICDYTDRHGYSPAMQEVADGVGVGKSTAYRYIVQLCSEGAVDYAGVRSLTSTRTDARAVRVPVLGEVACGIPKLAEENIDEYVRLPVALFGNDDYFILKASGDSMTGAGIDDGDLVLIRRQSSAEDGQIVVALTENEATLKRFFAEPERHRIRLHPENPKLSDIYVEACEIQGVAVKVLKDL